MDEDLRDDRPFESQAAVELPISREIDLHHFRPGDIASVVAEYLAAARAKGFSEVRIIHGKGLGIQRENVRKVLVATAFVISFGDDPSPRGGKGATLANLAPPN